MIEASALPVAGSGEQVSTVAGEFQDHSSPVMGGVDAGEVTGRDGIADHAAGAGVIQAELIGNGRDGGFVGNPQPGRDGFDDLDVLDLAQVVVRGRRGICQGLVDPAA